MFIKYDSVFFLVLSVAFLGSGCSRVQSDSSSSRVVLQFPSFYKASLEGGRQKSLGSRSITEGEQTIQSQSATNSGLGASSESGSELGFGDKSERKPYPVLVTLSSSSGQRPQFFQLPIILKDETFEVQPLEIQLDRGEIAIQVLMFLPDESLGGKSDGGMLPYLGYSDKILLNQAEQTIQLSLKPLTDFLGGDVAGRVISSDTELTGRVEYHVKVQNHLPPLKVNFFNGTIINGWFQLVALHSKDLQGIEYILVRKEVTGPLREQNIFGPGKVHNLETLYAETLNESVQRGAQVAIPHTTSVRSEWTITSNCSYGGTSCSSTQTWKFDRYRSAESYVLGFWKREPSVTLQDKAVTHDFTALVDYPSGTPGQFLYRYQSNLNEYLSNFITDSEYVQPHVWLTESSSSVWNEIQKITEIDMDRSPVRQGHGFFYFRGYTNTDINTISSYPLITENSLYFHKDLVNGLKDSFSGFRGIFKTVAFDQKCLLSDCTTHKKTDRPVYIEKKYYANSSDIEFHDMKTLTLLPGVSVKKMKVFVNHTESDFWLKDENTVCTPDLTLKVKDSAEDIDSFFTSIGDSTASPSTITINRSDSSSDTVTINGLQDKFYSMAVCAVVSLSGGGEFLIPEPIIFHSSDLSRNQPNN
jgi:hypothetical protein